MTAKHLRRFLILALVLGLVPEARARVAGGGPKKSDCYVEWEGVTAARGVAVTCEDGTTCDLDTKKDGKCTFGVGVCVYQNDVDGCTPVPVNSIVTTGRNPTVNGSPPITIEPPVGTPPFAAARCGPQTPIEVFLRKNRRGVEKPSKRVKLVTVARTDGRPKVDRDRLVLRCIPGPEVCPANPAGGPDQVSLTVPPGGIGSDLDNGHLGISYGFLTTGSAQLNMCLTGCDGSTNPVCQGQGPTGANTINGPTFGAPLPLLAAGTPVCVVNRFDPGVGEITGTADLATGNTTALVRLKSDVYLTTEDANLCPQCTGGGLGGAGMCTDGPNDGKACIVDGTVSAVLPSGTRNFNLSRSCPPQGPPIATLDIPLDLSTGTRSNTRSPACPDQASTNACGGGACTLGCTPGSNACFTMVPDPLNPGGPMVCADKKGGISQLCCDANGVAPCHPSAAEGGIVRTGLPVPVAPPWNEPGYPKSADAVLVSVFCEGATGNPALDFVTTGLPGPGALILPVETRYTKAQ